MKTKKSTKFIVMLLAFMAAVFMGCTQETYEVYTETHTYSTMENPDENFNYKVELGDISMQDYMTYQQWQEDNFGFYTYEKYEAEKNTLISQTLDGTYENKGTLSALELKAFLMEKGEIEAVVNSAINMAALDGSNITKYFTKEGGQYTKATWVYIEKI